MTVHYTPGPPDWICTCGHDVQDIPDDESYTLKRDEATCTRCKPLTLAGNDNYGKPRQAFADKLADASDDEYLKIAKQHIWLSAYANNNPRSDYHWMADACYEEAVRRNNDALYAKAWQKAAGTS